MEFYLRYEIFFNFFALDIKYKHVSSCNVLNEFEFESKIFKGFQRPLDQ